MRTVLPNAHRGVNARCCMACLRIHTQPGAQSECAGGELAQCGDGRGVAMARDGVHALGGVPSHRLVVGIKPHAGSHLVCNPVGVTVTRAGDAPAEAAGCIPRVDCGG